MVPSRVSLEIHFLFPPVAARWYTSSLLFYQELALNDILLVAYVPMALPSISSLLKTKTITFTVSYFLFPLVAAGGN